MPISDNVPTYRNVSKELRHAVDEYHLRVNDCRSCGICDIPERPEHFSTRPVFRGNIPCDLLLVFPAPRRIDVLSNSPLRGVEGSVVDDVVNAMIEFYPRLRVGLITAVHCYPFDAEISDRDPTKDHRDPTKSEVHACYHANVFRFMEMAKPRIVVLFGEVLKRYFPQTIPSVIYVTAKHPSSAIKSRTVDDYKRDLFYAVDKFLDQEGAVFICNKPARFTPRTKSG
ncbi:Uracil-DNA glycosylase-like [uncultured Caudovirales phage]|uniref:Uracil-DNA glycosylase-like n=1 Tax=uncultured Caudovirales phage TaxID=2100421 RepID=A0A6J5M961_9CAUD|nr:Uracil-DNA glycosylase-like [uncultured Caudovirales phage]